MFRKAINNRMDTGRMRQRMLQYGKISEPE